MLFFPLSKILWGLAAPSHILFWLVFLAAALGAMKFWRAGRCAAIAAAILFLLIGVLPTNRLLLQGIEDKFPRGVALTKVDGILTLGGGLNDRIRLVGTYALARRYPDARVVYSGGDGSLLDSTPDLDAQNARHILLALGLDPRRLTLEGRSRNTWENILFTQKLVKPRPGETWMLATSASQMPRAMEVARRLGWVLTPWPTDRLEGENGFTGTLNIPGNLWAFDNATREWIGLYAYRWSGMSHP